MNMHYYLYNWPICIVDKFIITIMDEDDAFFEVEQEEDEIR